MSESSVEVMADGLCNVAESSKFLGVSRATLYNLMEQGELIYVKFGKARRIPRRALLELAAANVKGGWKTSGDVV